MTLPPCSYCGGSVGDFGASDTGHFYVGDHPCPLEETATADMVSEVARLQRRLSAIRTVWKSFRWGNQSAEALDALISKD